MQNREDKRILRKVVKELMPFFFIHVTTNSNLAGIRVRMSVMDLEICYDPSVKGDEQKFNAIS
jgi:3-deoxy-D-arabino-heptulosonate 7-phosphate (DAHP) synthase class II